MSSPKIHQRWVSISRILKASLGNLSCPVWLQMRINLGNKRNKTGRPWTECCVLAVIGWFTRVNEVLDWGRNLKPAMIMLSYCARNRISKVNVAAWMNLIILRMGMYAYLGSSCPLPPKSVCRTFPHPIVSSHKNIKVIYLQGIAGKEQPPGSPIVQYLDRYRHISARTDPGRPYK